MARRSLSLDSLIPDPPARPEPAEAAPPPPSSPASKVPAYREGKTAFTAWANKEAYKQLKRLAVERETKVQTLLEEGMDLVFERYGYPEIARSQPSKGASS